MNACHTHTLKYTDYLASDRLGFNATAVVGTAHAYHEALPLDFVGVYLIVCTAKVLTSIWKRADCGSSDIMVEYIGLSYFA